MSKTFVQIWFTAETETISRPGRFVVVEVNKTFDELCIDIENNAFITGDALHTARVNAEPEVEKFRSATKVSNVSSFRDHMRTTAVGLRSENAVYDRLFPASAARASMEDCNFLMSVAFMSERTR